MANNAFSYQNYVFNRFSLSHYHHTDNTHGMPWHYLAFMEEGEVKLVSEKRTVMAKAGDVFYIPRGLPYHSYWHGEHIRFLSFGFSDTGTEEFKDLVLQRIDCGAEVAALVRAIPIEECGVRCDALSRFYTALSALLPFMERGNESARATVLARAKQLWLRKPSAAVAEIAADCHISEPYLYRIFHDLEKCTPGDYKTRILCEKAVSLLTVTDETVEAISERLGFSSASYFRKVLKKQTGQTPREIRKERYF